MELLIHKSDSHRKHPVRGKGAALLPQEPTGPALHPTQNMHPIVLTEG